MDENRQQAYLYLIQELLRCPPSSEQAIFNDNRDLLDAGLVQMMEQMAEALAEKGNHTTADSLVNLTRQLANALDLPSPTFTASPVPNYDSQFNFLLQVLQATEDSQGNPQVVYPMLQANIDKLDDNFAQILRDGTKAIFCQVEPEEAEDIAVVIGNFSNRIRDFPLGNRTSNLEIAITGFEIVATVFTRKAFPEEWATTQVNLGIVYYHRIRGERAENLEVAIRCYLAGLEVRTRNTFPSDWAQTQNNLGLAYCTRIRGERAENLEAAIHCFLNALKVYTHEAFPEKWAGTLNNLGNAYLERIRGERAENLEEAIRCFSQALEVRTRNAFPPDWARTQNNLGTAYSDRIWGERAENLEEAIRCFSQALEVRTREAFPSDWADTQNNLGRAYLYRIRGEREENLEEAIRCFSQALKVNTRNAFPKKWAMVQNNLGTAYSDRIEGEQTENLEEAIRCYLAALEVRTREAAPSDWAVTQDNLGIAYRNRIQGERAENLEAAIQCYLAALEIRTHEAFPEKWAGTLNNLGNAYLERIQGERAENLEAAICCFSDALKVFTRQAFPQTNIVTQFNLGLTYQNARQFRSAKTAFASAIDTIESQRDDIVSGSGREENKQKLAEQWNQLYQGIVKVCLDLHEVTQAIEYVERSKNRNLVEFIITRDRHTIFPAEVVEQLDRLRDEIASGQYELQNAAAEDPTKLAQYLQQLRQQRNELQYLYLPIGSGFQFKQFRSTLSDHTAIIEFYITTDKLLVFIITKQTQQPIISSSDLIDMNKLANWANSYLKAYFNKKSHWQRRLTTRLHLLAKILHVDEIIKQIPTECDQLILIPHRYLHLLPLHALPLAEDSSLFDRFPEGVSYAPSCQLLLQAQQRKRPNFSHLFAIQNPTNDLAYTDLEVQAITDYFNPVNILEKETATLTAINDTNLNAIHCAHFSCHGYFNPSNARKSALILANAPLASTPANPDTASYLNVREGETHDLNQCLTLDAILSLNLEQCRLVTLSACETGLIDFFNTSDEYIGLPGGFLIAGSPSVVSSLWRVNDLSTALLMIKFYQNLKSGLTVALALNQAQKWLRDATTAELQAWASHLKLSSELTQQIEDTLDWFDSNEKPFQAPYYWAGFCAVGQ